jgi:hypothetical protein
MIGAALIAVLVTTVPPTVPDDVEPTFIDLAAEQVGEVPQDVRCASVDDVITPSGVGPFEGYRCNGTLADGGFVQGGVPGDDVADPDRWVITASRPIPDTEIGRAVEQCIGTEFEGINRYEVLDEGHSVIARASENLVCLANYLGLPQWLLQLLAAEVSSIHTFGDITVVWVTADFGGFGIVYDGDVAPDL